MPKISENTMRELDDILKENNPDTDRLTAFLKLKTASKPQTSPQCVLGGDDISFDVDVDLIKLPEKNQQKEQQQQDQQAALTNSTQKAAKKLAQSETVKDSIEANVQPQPKRVHENLPSRRSHSASPAHTLRSPAADKLRRVAVSRRSSGRRDLQREFDNAVNKQSSAFFEFMPEGSSTPGSAKLAGSAVAASLPSSAVSSPTAALAVCQPLPNHDEFEVSFQASLMQMNRKENYKQIPNQTTQHPNSPRSTGERGTFTVAGSAEPEPESGPEPELLPASQSEQQPLIDANMGQLPTRSQTNTKFTLSLSSSQKQARVRLRRMSQLMDSSLAAHGEKQPEAESVVQDNRQTEPASTAATAAAAATPHAVTVEAAGVSCGMQTSSTPVPSIEKNSAEDETDTPPLNLAPEGGDITRQRRRCEEQQYKETTMQLLGLQRTRSKNMHAQKPAQGVLNKPPRPAINGEQFAEELARMSNYEILDLRKRNSRLAQIGKPESTTPDQLAMEQSIQMEMVRRNLNGMGNGLPCKVTSPLRRSSATADHSLLSCAEYSLKERRKRFPRRGSAINTKLKNYMQLPQTIEERLKTRSKSGSKRSLYTKGNSDTEENRSQSPPKASRLSFSSIQIAPAPPDRSSTSEDNEDIPIVPPPPASIRYSRQLRRSVRFSSVGLVGQPAQVEDAAKQAQDATVEIVENIPTPPPPQEFIYAEQDQNAHAEQTQTQPQGVECDVLEDLPIVPPPPAAKRNLSQSRNSARFSSGHVPSPALTSTKKRQSQAAYVDALENILIVPPPPVSMRYSRQLARSQDYIYTEEEQVADSEQDADGEQDANAVQIQPQNTAAGDLEDLPVVPPPPASMRYSRQSRRSVRSNPVDMPVETPQESIFAEEEQPLNNNAEQGMEELRMQTPTPPADALTASNFTRLEKTLLDEQPSTSRAAREAFELSISRQQSTKNKETKDSRKQQQRANLKKTPLAKEGGFKKPRAPVGRAGQNSDARLKAALDKLRITLANETLPPEENGAEDSHNSTGVRRSKRGQVPLRNTWVHSVKDPFKFTFFERSISTYAMHSKAKTRKTKKKPADNCTSSLSRPPLCSSTPRNEESAQDMGGTLKRKREEPMESGIERLPEITEEDAAANKNMRRKRQSIDEQLSQQKRVRRKPLKRNPLDSASDSDSAPENERATEPALPDVPELIEVADEPTAPLEPAPASTLPPNDAQTQLLHLADWLRGANDQPPASADASDYENNGMRFTSASDLEFSTLDGIEYSFYGTEDKCAMGYMRFKPLQQRGLKRNKTNTLRFIALYGDFDVEVHYGSIEMQRCILKPGDMVEIKMGSRFNITNRLNDNSVLIVNRK